MNPIKLMLRRKACPESIRRVHLSVLCSVLFLSANFLQAQRLLTLEEAIATALQYNYDIRLSRNDSAVAALDNSFRNAVFLPRLNANAGMVWNRNNQKQDFANGTKREGDVKTNNLNSSI